MLATRAAVELDSLRRGNSSGTEAVHRLGDLLHNSLGSPATQRVAPQSSWLMDPSTVVLVARALTKARESVGPSDSDIYRLTKEVAQSLQQAAAQSSSESVEELRDFCIALARGVSSHRQHIRTEALPHRFRR